MEFVTIVSSRNLLAQARTRQTGRMPGNGFDADCHNSQKQSMKLELLARAKCDTRSEHCLAPKSGPEALINLKRSLNTSRRVSSSPRQAGTVFLTARGIRTI